MRMPAIFWSEQRFYAKFFSLDAKYQQLKRQCHEIFDIIILLKIFLSGPCMNRLKQSRKPFFVFSKLFDFNVQQSRDNVPLSSIEQ